MNKHIWKIDLVVVLMSVFILMGLIGYARPLVIAPINFYESTSGNILFEFKGGDVLLIDDNMDFSSPDKYRAGDGLILSLESGVYYWKINGVLGSEVRTLTIKSRVELELVEINGGIGVRNVGNTNLNVDVYDGEKLIEKRKVEIGKLASGGNKFIGEQNE